MKLLGLVVALALGLGALGFSCSSVPAWRPQQLQSRQRQDGSVVMDASRSGRQQVQQQTRKEMLLEGMLGLTAGALALGCVV